MKVYTSHLRSNALPTLVPEGFSWAAALFGWLWLLFHRAWIPAALNFGLLVLVSRSGQWLGSAWPLIGLIALQGWLARDLWRWSLAQQGYTPGPVIAARSEDEAMFRLLAESGDAAGGGA